MSFVLANLVTDLKAAFQAVDWLTSAQLFSTAIDTYFKSGTVTTHVTAIVVPPLPAPPYGATGTGTGNPITTGLATLITSTTTAFAVPLWASVTGIISPAIETLVLTSTLTTSVTGAIIGVGVLTPPWVSTGLSKLTTDLGKAFTTGIDWIVVATDIATAIDIYFKSITVNTKDSGPSPYPWEGTGISTGWA